jgi:hypothetical protein
MRLPGGAFGDLDQKLYLYPAGNNTDSIVDADNVYANYYTIAY